MAAWWASALGLLAVKQWGWEGRHQIKRKLCCASEEAKYPKQLFCFACDHSFTYITCRCTYFPSTFFFCSLFLPAVLLCGALLMSLTGSYSPSPWLPLYLIPLPWWCTPTGLDMQNLPAGNGGCSLQWSTQLPLPSTAGNYSYLLILHQHFAQLAFSGVQWLHTGLKSTAGR